MDAATSQDSLDLAAVFAALPDATAVFAADPPRFTVLAAAVRTPSRPTGVGSPCVGAT